LPNYIHNNDSRYICCNLYVRKSPVKQL